MRKQAYTRQTRTANYVASLKLEGITAPKSSSKPTSREEIIAKYTAPQPWLLAEINRYGNDSPPPNHPETPYSPKPMRH